jgi:DNA-binding MarR family transcriptional regulator
VAEAFAVPAERSSLRELSRPLDVLIGREGMRRTLHATAARAGLDLSPAAAFLLVRLKEDPGLDAAALASARGIRAGVLEAARGELTARGLIEEGPDGHPPTWAGSEAAARPLAAHRDELTEMLAGWSPERHAELRDLCARMAPDAVPAPRESAAA